MRIREAILANQRPYRGVGRKPKHGLSGHRIFQIWSGMHKRCYNVRDKRYSRYGGRGITVCDAWHEPMNFVMWAANSGYADTLTIDRIDYDKGYSPNNCRWIALEEQARNSSLCRPISALGVSLVAAHWERKTGIRARTIRSRLRLGWSADDAVTTPARPKRKY